MGHLNLTHHHNNKHMLC